MALLESSPLPAGGNAQQQAVQAEGGDVDWSSVETVSQLVSRTTLAAMHALWRQHAAGMDDHCRAFAEKMYDGHSEAVKNIARVKDFDLRRVLQLLNAFTESARELVLTAIRDVRKRDDDFSQQLYQATRGAFARNLRAALEARDAWYREKLRGLRRQHEAQLAAVRHAAAVELQQRQMQLKIALARTLAKSARGDPHMLHMLASRSGPEGGAPPGPAALAAAAAAGSPPMDGAAASQAGPTTEGGGAANAVAVRGGAAAMAAVAAAANSMPYGGGGDGGGGGVMAAELGPEAAMLEELFEDANAADALNRELESSLARANGEILELREKLEASQSAALDASTDAGQWRSKWAIESTKTDSIKRESMAIIAKCEEHLTQLQQQHIAELSQRDYLLQRCRDTITALEAREAQRSSMGAPQ